MLKYKGEYMILKIKPTFIEKLWGGNYYSKLYHKNIDKIGEVVLFSTYHEFELVFIDNDGHEHPLITKYPHIYHQLTTLFPITLKLIDAKDDLSIQVHPDDQYANKYHQSLGKEEYWMILDALPSTEILIGHSITDLVQLQEVVKNHQLHHYMKAYKIQKDDLFFIPANTVHAIQKNTRILEIAQASILNFRVDDYQRIDENGQLRPLHIKEALDVIKIPDNVVQREFPDHLFNYKRITITQEKNIIIEHNLTICIVLKGTGFIDDHIIKEGMCFIMFQMKYLSCKGNMELLFLNSTIASTT